MKKYSILILLFIVFKGVACTCPIKKLSEWQKLEIENSDCIFIGEVIEVNKFDLTYKIKVTESLDGGDKIGNTYIGKNWEYCSPSISEIGKWIVYGRIEDEFLRLNKCGISRSFKNPYAYQIPPFPEDYKGLSENEKNKLFENLRVKTLRLAKTDLEFEITAIREQRDKNKKASR